MKQQLLLLEDVDSLGRKGELVRAKPGYIRNFLLPQGLAMVATKGTVRKQEALKKEREEQAKVDRKVSEALAERLKDQVFDITVKVDPEGHMYGSVSQGDVANLIIDKGFEIEKKFVQITKPLKVTGKHDLTLKLKEDVVVMCTLNIIPEGGVQRKLMEEVTPANEPEVSSEEVSEEASE